MTQFLQAARDQHRFEFGKNWERFLSVLDDERIQAAQESLQTMLGVSDLTEKRFLDVGCGSGLFSLTARRLGASVLSFDYDVRSVECARQLKKKYFPDDPSWVIEEGSVLDRHYLHSLPGPFDIVYAWGVLHHTGKLWQALENALPLVKKGGFLYIAIYNDQGKISQRWTRLKRFYNQAPRVIKLGIVLGLAGFLETRNFLLRIVHLKNPLPWKYWAEKKKSRGMSVWHDLVDWAGGYPFEVAKPEKVFHFVQAKGFELRNLKTCGGGLGNNEFVFQKVSPPCVE